MRELTTRHRAGDSLARLPAARGARDARRRSGSCSSRATAGWPAASTRRSLRRGLQLEREARAEGKDVRWLVVGKKGRSTLRFRRYDIAQAWVDLTDRPDYKHAEAAAHAIAELFTSGEVDRVTMVYNHYVSPLTQIGRDRARSFRSRARRSARTRRSGRRTRSRSRATSSTSPSRRSSSSGCCRPTSRRPSSARCSSRPPPSTGRG